MASSDLPRLLRIPRTDAGADDFTVLQVSSAGRNALDLKLIGTDGEDVYFVKGRLATRSTRSGGPWPPISRIKWGLIKPWYQSTAQSHVFVEIEELLRHSGTIR